MMGKTHILVGFGFGLAAGLVGVKFGLKNTVDIPTSVATMVVVGGSVFGGLIPDIDHTKSTVSRKVPFFAYPIYAINMFFNWLAHFFKGKINLALRWIADLFGHRGIFHWVLLWIGLCIATLIMEPTLISLLCFGLALGGLSHVLADTLTPSGVPWIIPSKKGRWHIANIKTNSKNENLFHTCVVVVDIVLFYLLSKGMF